MILSDINFTDRCLEVIESSDGTGYYFIGETQGLGAGGDWKTIYGKISTQGALLWINRIEGLIISRAKSLKERRGEALIILCFTNVAGAGGKDILLV